MNISYLTRHDASDVGAFSGLDFYVAKTLKKQGAEMNFIGNLYTPPTPYDKVKNKIYHSLGKKYLYDRRHGVISGYARKIQMLLQPDTDIIFSTGSTPIALLDTKKPIVFYSDATFGGMVDFYDTFSHLCKESIVEGNYFEQKALDTCRLAIFASDWAARTAKDHYNVEASKIKVIPFGANIESDRQLEEIKSIVKARPTSECNLLFLGVDWIRKGGDFAIAVVEELNRQGIRAKLHIAGIDKLPVHDLPDFAINHGFISKKTEEGKARLDKLFAESHFLLLPTKAEAFGLVFAEASSFGLPSIAPSVGGIPTAITDNVNGKTFPLTATKEEYAGYIAAVFSNKAAYEEFCYSSFNEYTQRLNWKVNGRSIMTLLKQL